MCTLIAYPKNTHVRDYRLNCITTGAYLTFIELQVCMYIITSIHVFQCPRMSYGVKGEVQYLVRQRPIIQNFLDHLKKIAIKTDVS